MRVKSRVLVPVVAGLLGLSVVGALFGFYLTEADPQMVGINGWEEFPIFTVDETIRGYTPPGILDGIAAFPLGRKGVKFLVNHELTSAVGYPYELANGAVLTGARVSSFYVLKESGYVVNAGLAYDTIYNRAGEMVTGPDDLEFGGLNRLCSSQGVSKGTFSFMDNLYFTGEETGGGTEFVLDVKRKKLWAAPAMGRAAWENVTSLSTGDDSTVAILVGDDRGAAPLILYIGEKERGGNVLERNGLAKGKLYVWVADNGDVSPEDWNGTGTSRSGKFVEIDYYRPDLAGNGERQAGRREVSLPA
jgi:glycerophosphoryl diester phosphodiesterase